MSASKYAFTLENGRYEASTIADNYTQAIGWYNQAAQKAKVSLAQPGSTAAASTPTATFVIITTSAIVAGSDVLDDYVAMKERLGWAGYVATEADWGGGTGDAAAEHIRAWLQANA